MRCQKYWHFLSFFWSGHGTEVCTFQVPHYSRSNPTFQADTIICYRLYYAAFLPQSISSEVSGAVFSCLSCHYMSLDWTPHHTGGSGECDHFRQHSVNVIVEAIYFFLLSVWCLWRSFRVTWYLEKIALKYVQGFHSSGSGFRFTLSLFVIYLFRKVKGLLVLSWVLLPQEVV